ncbi:MAG TPA: ATP-binding protein, partial [Candidatus Methanoperedens sp.]
QYKDILFLDKDGTILLSVAGKSEVIGPYAKKLVSEALRTRKIIFSDLYGNKVTGDIHLSIVVPILSEDRKDTLGVFLLRVDPYLFLYPLIEKWPTPSRTAETMLIRREGSEVVYLNDVRHQKGTALTLRLPISNPYLPAAVAAMGEEGIFEGVDYRGREVLAALRSIPDSSWIIISKVDKEEVYAPIRGHFWNVTLVIGLCIFSAGASVLLIWRKREEEGRKKYLRQLEDTVKLRTEELDQAYKQLKESYKDLESFSYSVSHDLRAPLRIIRSLSEIVLNDNNDKLSDEDKKLLNSIQGHAKRMDKLVLALLDLSKIGRQDMRIDEIDIAKEAALIWADLKVAAPDRNVTVTIPDLPTAYGDVTLIRQVISNLLSNAIKFTSTKDMALIEVGCKRGDIEDVYYVKDNGAGFDMKYADKLFGVFQRLHSTKEFEGTGIGLSTVERIIRRHGGRVWADGRPNEGATFYFALPRKVN